MKKLSVSLAFTVILTAAMYLAPTVLAQHKPPRQPQHRPKSTVVVRTEPRGHEVIVLEQYPSRPAPPKSRVGHPAPPHPHSHAHPAPPPPHHPPVHPPHHPPVHPAPPPHHPPHVHVHPAPPPPPTWGGVIGGIIDAAIRESYR